jgi:hypothetical protein
MTPRWSDYFMTRDFSAFWAERLSEPGASVCLITGIGFDPRCTVGLERLLTVSQPGQVGFLGLRLNSPLEVNEPSRERNRLAERHEKLIAATSATQIGIGQVALQDGSRFPVGGPRALDFVASHLQTLKQYRHVVVDISGMPRSIFFPLISYLCSRADQNMIENLHVILTEDQSLDANIRLSEFGDADYVHTFRMAGKKKLVWVPVLNKNERDRVLKIFGQVKDDCVEICPILPFPADSLRKADDILIDNSEVLFQELDIAPTNFLLCDETNPFDIYRKIVGLHDYYVEKLGSLLGDVTTVVSPLSTKLLSLGMLLAAIERRLPVSYVEAGMYDPPVAMIDSFSANADQTVEIWLTGEPYRQVESEE